TSDAADTGETAAADCEAQGDGLSPEDVRALAAELQDLGASVRDSLLARGLIGERGAAVLDAYADFQRRANAFLADGCAAVAADAGGARPVGESDDGGAALRLVVELKQELEKAGLALVAPSCSTTR
ncbi:hypothetical protein MNEG_4808, partial [Monoraphidium neglectum]